MFLFSVLLSAKGDYRKFAAKKDRCHSEEFVCVSVISGLMEIVLGLLGKSTDKEGMTQGGASMLRHFHLQR